MPKKETVRSMFDSIAWRYDFLNHFLSVSIDCSWRKKVVKSIAQQKPNQVLDIATGTADLAIQLTKYSNTKIIGIDISENMLAIGEQKIQKKNLNAQITLLQADSEKLPFDDASFDCVMVAFGVRNFENLETGLSEMKRVLKPGGQVAILEFSHPDKTPFKQFYHSYTHQILPRIGSFFTKNEEAYSYFPQSIETFPDKKAFMKLLSESGFSNFKQKRFTFGIATYYSATKP
jgi:demethylmenaquinone methyltransferase/2-methoxy-6-polyprenyl-1,4-benzoquinol methylase